eukprot:c17218_g2_i1 orf=107-412(+)
MVGFHVRWFGGVPSHRWKGCRLFFGASLCAATFLVDCAGFRGIRWHWQRVLGSGYLEVTSLSFEHLRLQARCIWGPLVLSLVVSSLLLLHSLSMVGLEVSW